MSRRFAPLSAVALAFAAIVTAGAAQEQFSFFVASSPESVERMLRLADLREGDVVVDLGSGDGLIPLTAARMNESVRGRGVDIDPELVARASERADREGLADRVQFHHRNAYDAELADATVITMWLFPDMMRLLRPVILERARPGTRVLTSTWDLGSWEPDAVDDETYPRIFMWIVPARVSGGWRWTLDVDGRRHVYDALLEQRFQQVEGVARVGWRRELLESPALSGDALSFELQITLDGLGLTHHAFAGTIDGQTIDGTVTLTPPGGRSLLLPWRALRVEESAYFEPTGTDMFNRAETPWVGTPAP